MMHADADSTAQYRALKAAAFTMALLLMVPGIEALLKFACDSPGAVAAASGLDSRAIVEAGDPFATLDRIEGLASAGGGSVPEEVFEEVGILPGAQDVRVDETGTVLGYVVEGGSAEALDRLTVHMQQRGWTAVPLAGMEGATFVKRGGACTWALATCTQAGESTSVVVRCMRS